MILPINSAKLGAGCGSRVDPELAQNALGMVSRRVGADMQSVRDRSIGPALSEENRYLEFPAGKPVPVLQVRGAPPRVAIALLPASLFPKLPAQLPHLPHRFPQLTEQQLTVAPEIRECRQKIAEAIVRYSVYAVWHGLVPFVP